ncbi:MAG: OprO/OprP family phosphate-selective porin [Bacteroidaceae bacterium]|nr:OprO/OprP family phosphate-selective porin [Bacteroidaceae bacterium]
MNTAKHRVIVLVTMLSATISAFAQSGPLEQVKDDFVQNTTFGGCIIGRAGWTDNEASKSETDFQVRSVRAHVAGKVLDFGYMLQMEMTGVSGGKMEEGPHIVDAWIEWQKYDFLRVKIGQQKRAFTFENPYHPMDIGLGTYSQCVTYLGGYVDRVGEQMSHGRDVGLALQGDLFPMGDHKFLHYHAGIYNGQGVNHSDKNKHKDLIGGLWVEPTKDLLVGIYGWSGNYVNSEGLTLKRERWTAGLQYESDWSVRAEYIGDREADGWYALVGVPVVDKLKIYGRWDVYRSDKSWNTTVTNYGLAAGYTLCKNLRLQANYTFTHNRTAVDRNYNTCDIQAYVRF